MATEDSTSTYGTMKREQLAAQFPMSSDSFAVWFDPDFTGALPWAINDEDGGAIVSAANYEDARKVAHALKVSEEGHVIDDDERKAITYALLIGLESYGEIERLTNAADIADRCKHPIPDALRPIRPTGCNAGAIGAFAEALFYIHV